MFKIATWNVNSIKMRLDQVIEWLNTNEPTVLAMQETKSVNDMFPAGAFNEIGYNIYFSGQKAYNGVAIAAKSPINEKSDSLIESDEQKRFLECDIDGIRIINVYVPNGQAVGSDKYEYKLDWMDALYHHLEQALGENKQVIVLGDFNIAPQDIDVHDPKAWEGQVLCSQKERMAFERILSLGFHDSVRMLQDNEKIFTWWDYRGLGFQLNKGLRIDHLLISDALKASAVGCVIDRVMRKRDKPSDHVPVMLSLV